MASSADTPSLSFSGAPAPLPVHALPLAPAPVATPVPAPLPTIPSTDAQLVNPDLFTNLPPIYLPRNYDALPPNNHNDPVQLQIIELDVNTITLAEDFTIEILPTIMIKKFKNEIQQNLQQQNTDIKEDTKENTQTELEMIYFYGHLNKLQFIDESQPCSLYSVCPIKNNDIIYICRKKNYLMPFLKRNLKYIELRYNSDIHINYNNIINPETDINIKYDQIIKIDMTMTVQSLRGIFEKEFNTKKLILRRDFRKTELKDDNKMLHKYFVYETGFIFVEFGERNNDLNENIFSIYIQDEFIQRNVIIGYIRQKVECKLNKKYKIHEMIPISIIDLVFLYKYINTGDQPLIFVGDIYLNKNNKLSQVKTQIYEKFERRVPLPKNMRIREFDKGTLTNIYYDNYKFGKNVKKYGPLYDFKMICCQNILSFNKNEFINVDEKDKNIVTSKQVLINICRWYPETLTFGLMIEIPFNRNDVGKKEFFKQLSLLTTISINNLGVIYPGTKFINKIDAMSNIKCNYWRYYDEVNDPNYYIPWYLRDINNGYVIIYKNKSEKEKQWEWDDICTKKEKEQYDELFKEMKTYGQ